MHHFTKENFMIEIERVIQEISPLQRLEKLVEEAEARVADRQRAIAAISTQLNTANDALMTAKKVRETHAMAARLGDATAKDAVAHARDEQHAAEQDLQDLRIAQPEAEAQLALAEKNAASARHALGKLMAEQIIRKRISVAGQIDGAIADLTKLLLEFERLGQDIANTPDIPPSNMFGVVDHSNALGLRRVRAALPKIFDRIYPNAQHDEMKKENLATTEALHWNLPLESGSKAA
jgi:hypothetical protein